MVIYKLINVGRDKWTGYVRAQSRHAEHVEAAVLREAVKHLKSKIVEIGLTDDHTQGVIIVGGYMVAGEFILEQEVAS